MFGTGEMTCGGFANVIISITREHLSVGTASKMQLVLFAWTGRLMECSLRHGS